MANDMGLRGLIRSQFPTDAEFAEQIGWSRQRLSRILQQKQPPTIPDVREIADGLGVPFMMVAKFFLDSKSSIV